MIRASRPLRAIKIGVSIANDSRESIRTNSHCESPVPLSAWVARKLEAADPRSCSKEAMKQMLDQGHDLTLPDEAWELGTSSTQTRKPGQSAQAESTQAVSP